MISVIVYGRNDSHGYNLPKRAALSFNCIAEVLTDPDDEIIFVDCNTPDDLPTFPESIADTLTPRARKLLRILRLRPAQYEKGKNGTKFKVLEPLCRNVAIRRSNPRNRWILNTNTDMVFIPLAEGKSLSEVAAKLSDGFYELPRFEMPEILWETTDRAQPKAIIQSFKHWGRRLHVNEMVANMKEIVFDGPGDFQLALRKQMFAIQGMNEQMVLGWHVDSNLCKRMFLLNGETKSLLDQVYAYHCDHTRLNTVYHSATESTANDYRIFFNDVATSCLPAQAETWGLPKEEIEEVRLTEEYAGRYATVLESLLPGLSVPMLKSALMGESFNHGLLYDNHHILPYITDHLTMIPPTATVGYFGNNVELLRLIAEFRKAYGHTGRILYDETLMRSGSAHGFSSLPAQCVAMNHDQLFEQAFMFCFDLSMKNFPQILNGAGYAVPKPSLAAGGHATLLLRRFLDCARYEKEQLDEGNLLTRKFLIFGSHNTWFESATTQIIGVVLTPYSSYVRHGFVRKDAFTRPFQAVFGHHMLIGDSFKDRFEWLAGKVGRPVTLLEYCLSEMRLKAAVGTIGTNNRETIEFVTAAAVAPDLARAVFQLEIAIAEADGQFEQANRLGILQGQLEKSSYNAPSETTGEPSRQCSAPRNAEVSTAEIALGTKLPTIGVDARTFYYADSNARGVGHYAFHHLLHAARLKPDWQFILYGDAAAPTATVDRLLQLPNVRQKLLSDYQSGEIDLWHIPDPLMLKPAFGSPMEMMSKVPSSVIFYDLIGLRYYWGGWQEPVRREYLERLEQLLQPRFNVLAISEYTRKDLITTIGINPKSVSTIMAGLNRSENQRRADTAAIRAVKEKFGITKPFFLHVGALDPHKNFETVINSLAQIRPQGSAQLVVVGEKDHFMKQIADFIAKMKMKDIIFTGFIPRSDLEVLYQEAISLLALSHFEGFGFPVLEAMAQGCPVITTNVTSIPEVAGDAALMFSPKDVTNIKCAMQELLNQPQKRAALREKGRVRAAQFSWTKTAGKTISVWQEMLGLAIEEPAHGTESAPTTSSKERAVAVTKSPPNHRPAPIENLRPVPDHRSRHAGKPEVVWFAPWQNPSGYCSEALVFAKGLATSASLEFVEAAKTKMPSFVAGLPSDLKQLLQDHLRTQVDIAGKICISHMPGSGFSPHVGAAYCIGRTMFETDRLPRSWVTRCNQMDEVWVPSQFNLETFATSGVERDKLVVMPGAVDERHFDPELHKPLPLPNRAAFNFLSVFEWSSRKGWNVLLAAYLREFSAEDDVCLYLRSYLIGQPDGDPQETIWRFIREHAATLELGDKKWPRIEILSNHLSTADLPRLYSAIDCLVAPSRGEGWGRPQHEAMMMGRPVIATNWSGNTEFMKPENSYLLNYELVKVAQVEPDLWHYRGHVWANPSESHLRELMRHVQQNPMEAAQKGRVARAYVKESFGCERMAERMLSRLKVIQQKSFTPTCPAATAHLIQVKPEYEEQKAQTVHVAWQGSFLDFGSLSHVNRELTLQLSRQPQMQLTCVGKNMLPGESSRIPALQETALRLKGQAPKQTQVTVCHSWPPCWNAPDTGAWVMIQPWEFGVLPADWTQRLGGVDEVWVYSDYVRRVYVDSGVDPEKVKIVPLGIDPEKFKPGIQPLNLATAKSFKFLFVGGTIRRKGPDLVLDAYLNNFTAADDVCLVIKDFGGKNVYAGQTLGEQIRAAQSQLNAPEILYLDQELTPEALSGLYTACDCLVHPYRGEGFGLPVLEAMACGLPVIVTAGGSTDDFATDEWAYRIPSLRQPIGSEVSEMKLAGNGWWLEPDSRALAERMRWIFSNCTEARTKGQAAGDYIRKEWTWARSGRIAAQRLQNLVTRKKMEFDAVRKRRTRKAAQIVLPPVAKVGHLAEARERLLRKEYLPAWNAALTTLKARPFHPEACLLLAEIARAAGDVELAKSCASQARLLAPNWKPAQHFLRSIPSKGRDTGIAWSAPFAIASPPRLSVCLITKNEERFLESCLKSVRDVAQQIVVVDTGSTDRTTEIARSYNAEIFSFPWSDDFSAARNAALEHATGDWILVLDADEELCRETRANLLKEIQDPAVMAYRLPIIDPEEEGCSYVPRLLRNAPGLFFVGRIHEQIFSSVEVRRKEWGLEILLGTATLLHHGYTKEIVIDRNKVVRNLRLLERGIEELPNEPNLIMNFGLELIRSGQLEAGLEHYWEAFHIMSALPSEQIVPELRETLLTQHCTHLMGASQFAEIVHLLNTPLGRSAPLTASMHFVLGLAQIELKQFVEAAAQMRQCLEKRTHPALSPINKDIRKAGPRHCLAICLMRLNQPADASDTFQLALAEDPTSRPLRFDYAMFQAGQGRPLDALKLLHQLVSEKADNLAAWQAGGQIALGSPDYLEFACDWTAEAIKQYPDNPTIGLQRAECLLLSDQSDNALPLWHRFHSSANPGHLAAILICEMLGGGTSSRLPPAGEKIVSQEFLTWYRRLLNTRAAQCIHRLNGCLSYLSAVLPTAANFLETVLSEARQASA